MNSKIKIYDVALEHFVASLEKSTVAKVLRTIDLLEEFGHRLGMPHSKKVAPQLFELRTRGAQEVRIFYTFHQGDVILLLHGYVKKSRTIPHRELTLALQRLKCV